MENNVGLEIPKIKDLDKVIQDFINTKRLKKASKHTLVTYETSLRDFIEYAESIMDKEDSISNMGFFEVEGYVDFLDNKTYKDRKGIEKSYSSSSKNLRISAVKSLFKFMLSRRYIGTNTAVNLESAGREAKKIPKVLTKEQATKLLETVNGAFSYGTYDKRNYAIISVFLNCGLRLSELINLKLEDINMRTRSMNIRGGKGGKDRMVYFGEDCKQAIKDYLEVREEIGIPYVFISKEKCKMSDTGVRNMVKAVMKKAGIRGGSTHTLRHTCATAYYEATNDIRVVQKILGHSDISTTMIYTHIHDSKLKEAANLNLF